MTAAPTALFSGIRRLSDEEYFALPHISKSGLDAVSKSPSYFRYWRDRHTERKPTKAMEFGTAAHCAILEPDVFNELYEVLPDFDRRTNVGKAAYQAFLEGRKGKRFLSEEDYEAILGMSNAVRLHKSAAFALKKGMAECAVTWKDPVTGLDCKAKIDWLNPVEGLLVDLKTTESASLEAFSKSVVQYGYLKQMAFYRDGAAAGAPAFPVSSAVIIAVEKAPPYLVATYQITEEQLAEGRRLYRRDLDLYAACLRDNTWPGLPETFEPLVLPTWYRPLKQGA